MQAFILVQTEVGKAALVAAELRRLAGIDSAEDVVGPYDVIVRASAGSDEELTEVVRGIQQSKGITRTLTCQLAAQA